MMDEHAADHDALERTECFDTHDMLGSYFFLRRRHIGRDHDNESDDVTNLWSTRCQN